VAVALALLLLAWAGAAAPAADAQQRAASTLSGWKIEVHAGSSLPLSPSAFSSHYRPGFSVGLEGSREVAGGASALAGASYRRFGPSAPNELVGALPGTEVDGAQLSALAAFVGGRCALEGLSQVRPYGTVRAGGAQVRVQDAEVRSETGARSVSGSSEIVPWLGAGIGAEIPVSGRLAITIEPRAAVAFTESDPTVSASVAAGLQIR